MANNFCVAHGYGGAVELNAITGCLETPIFVHHDLIRTHSSKESTKEEDKSNTLIAMSCTIHSLSLPSNVINSFYKNVWEVVCEMVEKDGYDGNTKAHELIQTAQTMLSYGSDALPLHLVNNNTTCNSPTSSCEIEYKIKPDAEAL